MRKLLLIALAFCSLSASAQLKKDKKGKIRAYKIAFLTEKLDLTESEAEKFWPLYNTFDKEMMELRRKEGFGLIKKIKSKGGIEKLSEEEAKEVVLQLKEINNRRHELKSTFYKKAGKFLSYKKLLILEVSEHEFNKKLLRKLRRGRGK